MTKPANSIRLIASAAPYAGLPYLEDRWRSSVEAMSRQRRVHLAFALPLGLAAAAFAIWKLQSRDPSGAAWNAAWNACSWAMLAGVVQGGFALTLGTLRTAWRAIDSAKRGARGAPEDLMSIPGLPRPLYFHAQRAGLLPILDAHAKTAFQAGFACALPLLPFCLYSIFEDNFEFSLLARVAGTLAALAAWIFAAGAIAVVPILLALPAFSLMVGFGAGLGDVARFAWSRHLPRREREYVAERIELDERWGDDRGESVGAYALDVARRASISAALLGILLAGQAAAIFAVLWISEASTKEIPDGFGLAAFIAIIFAVEGLFAASAYPILRVLDRQRARHAM